MNECRKLWINIAIKATADLPLHKTTTVNNLGLVLS